MRVLLLGILILATACTEIDFQEDGEGNDMQPTAPNAEQNYGNEVTLSGSQSKSTGKLLRVTDHGVDLDPLIIAVSATVVNNGSSANAIGPIASGTFGSGGIAHKVEFDCKPDTVVALPGTSVDLNAEWDYAYLFLNGAYQKVQGNSGLNWLPASSKVKANAKHGRPTTANATRTIAAFINTTDVLTFDLPAFSDTYMLFAGDDTFYSANLSVTFLNGSIPMLKYTGTQLLAIKNAGGGVSIPGGATTIQVGYSAGPPSYFIYNVFGLNL